MTYAVVGKFAKRKGLRLARDERKTDAAARGFLETPPPVVIERGPWRASKDGRCIESDDFTHDVTLRVTGDFEDDTQRAAYAKEIARRLNLPPNP